MNRITTLLTIIILASSLSACKTGSGKLRLSLSHTANDKDLVCDSVFYTNTAGNTFIISEIQYFISNIEILNNKGQWVSLDANDNVHYIDTDIEQSKTIVLDNIDEGKYSEIRFTFGLDETDNISKRFVDPPMSDMFWPDPLGGGYHYMKLNGKWTDENGMLVPMNIHLGIGQNSSFTEFYHNYFSVSIPVEIVIADDNETAIGIEMVIDNWFKNPNIIDLSEYGNSIMQNQEAQELYKANGHDVFRIKI